MNDVTHVTFWSGLTTIGGTVVSVECGGYRVVLDFGFNYRPNHVLSDKQVLRRPAQIVRDYLALDTIPRVPGLYTADALGPESDLPSAEHSDTSTIVLISHLHLDHMGAMGLVSAAIPVLMSDESLRLYKALEDIGEGVEGRRGYHACSYHVPFSHGPMVITPLPVDHDVSGACSFHIATPGGTLLYTGDYRLCGAHPPLSDQWLRRAQELGVDILISEGTTLRVLSENDDGVLLGDNAWPETMTPEYDLPKKLHPLLDGDQIVFFNLYHRNLRRLTMMLDAGKATDRTVLLEHETALLAQTMLGRNDFVEVESVAIAEIKLHPHRYLIQNSYRNCLRLLDFKGDSGLYIHSNGTPLGDFDPAFSRLKGLIEVCGFAYQYVGATGHAIPQHLQYVADTIAPQVLVPLHSFAPERLVANSGRQLLPKLGVRYCLQSGDLSEAP